MLLSSGQSTLAKFQKDQRLPLILKDNPLVQSMSYSPTNHYITTSIFYCFFDMMILEAITIIFLLPTHPITAESINFSLIRPYDSLPISPCLVFIAFLVNLNQSLIFLAESFGLFYFFCAASSPASLSALCTFDPFTYHYP